jgi:hypothetical protein
MTEKANNKSNVRISLNEKLRENNEKDEAKSKKPTHKEPVKPTPTKKNVKPNADGDKKKKDGNVEIDSHINKEDPTVNPFPDQSKTHEPEVAKEAEAVNQVETKENNNRFEEKVDDTRAEEKKTDSHYPEEVDINLEETTPVVEKNQKPDEIAEKLDEKFSKPEENNAQPEENNDKLAEKTDKSEEIAQNHEGEN